MRFASWMALEPVPAVPELLLHQGEDMDGLWEAVGGPTPPYWAFPWPGGQALARHLLDHPGLVRGKRVLDLATGSGLVALAARRAGAVSVLAADVDPLSQEAVAANAAANQLTVQWTGSDLLDGPLPEVDLVLAGDVLYDRVMSARVLHWLAGAAVPVLLADPGRDYLRPQEFVELTAYDIPTLVELEGTRVRRTRVFTLAAHPAR